MRLQVIKEYQLKGILPIKDLLLQINCIPVDCKDLERCPICKPGIKTPNAHFEIPQIINDFGASAIAYIGSVDRMNSFSVYVNSNFTNLYQKYRKRGKDKPYVYIDPAPNDNAIPVYCSSSNSDQTIANASLIASALYPKDFKKEVNTLP